MGAARRCGASGAQKRRRRDARAPGGRGAALIHAIMHLMCVEHVFVCVCSWTGCALSVELRKRGDVRETCGAMTSQKRGISKLLYSSHWPTEHCALKARASPV